MNDQITYGLGAIAIYVAFMAIVICSSSVNHLN